MAGLDGKEVKLYVDVSSTMTEVSCQGDAVYNSGKTLQIARAKNCKHPYTDEAGATITFTALVERPQAADHAVLLDAADNDTEIDVEFRGTQDGDPDYSGSARVVYEQLAAPQSGAAEYSFTVAFVNDPTRTTVGTSGHSH